MLLSDIDVQYFLQVHEEIGPISGADVAVSCPMCREGRSWGRKHRLHLYIKPSYDAAAIACFNCNYSSNMYGYLKEFHPSEFNSYRKAMAGQGFAELRMSHEATETKKSDELDFTGVDIGLDMTSNPVNSSSTVIENVVPKVQNIQLPQDGFEDDEAPMDMSAIGGMDFGFDMSAPLLNEVNSKTPPAIKPILEHNPNTPHLIEPVKNLTELPQGAIDYIQNRGLEVQKSWRYSGKNNKIRFNNTDIILSEYIIVPLIMDEKWYGFQALAWKQKKFFVYLVTGNTSFKVENWDKINKDEPVYIMESIYDRLSSGLENSIAVLGSNLHEDRLKELKQPVFCLDNFRIDDKAYEETLAYSIKGYKTFIWPRGSEKFKDTNDLRKIGVPYEKISNMILNNIYSGLPAQARLKLI